VSALLKIRDLVVRFYTPDGVVHAVNNVTYTLQEGETLGVVGESGSGKSVHVLSILQLIPSPPGRIESGEVIFNGKDLLTLRDEEIRRVRGGEIAMVFQDPMTSLHPVLTVDRHLHIVAARILNYRADAPLTPEPVRHQAPGSQLVLHRVDT